MAVYGGKRRKRKRKKCRNKNRRGRVKIHRLVLNRRESWGLLYVAIVKWKSAMTPYQKEPTDSFWASLRHELSVERKKDQRFLVQFLFLSIFPRKYGNNGRKPNRFFLSFNSPTTTSRRLSNKNTVSDSIEVDRLNESSRLENETYDDKKSTNQLTKKEILVSPSFPF